MSLLLATRKNILPLYSDRENSRLYFNVIKLRQDKGIGTRRIARILSKWKKRRIINNWLYSSKKPRGVKGIKELETMNLLPLEVSNSVSFYQFVRTFGLRYSDSCIYEQKGNNSFTIYICFGDEIDAIQFCKYIKQAWNLQLEYHFSSNAYYVYLPSSIARLMIFLGSPEGDKTLQTFRLPEWIYDLSDILKWEFIDGIFSGDGSSPMLQKCGTCCYSLRLSLSSEKSIADNFCRGFMEDLWHLISNLNIKVSKPKVMCNQPRISKNGKIKYLIEMRILTQKNNMIKFLENVKYRYRHRTSQNIKRILSVLRGG